ncbi:MAG: hypothetical protein AB1480_04660 [Nitrospirota bacterium]
MDKTLRIVIPNEVRNLVLSGKDCHVAPLLAMTLHLMRLYFVAHLKG